MKKSTSKFNETFIKNYNENCGKGYTYPKNLHDLHNDLLFLPEKMKTKKCCKLMSMCCTHKNFKTSTKSWI